MRERRKTLTMPDSAWCRVCLRASFNLRYSTPNKCREISRSRIGVTDIELKSNHLIRALEHAIRWRSRSVTNSCPTSESNWTGRPGRTEAAVGAEPRKVVRRGRSEER